MTRSSEFTEFEVMNLQWEISYHFVHSSTGRSLVWISQRNKIKGKKMCAGDVSAWAIIQGAVRAMIMIFKWENVCKFSRFVCRRRGTTARETDRLPVRNVSLGGWLSNWWTSCSEEGKEVEKPSANTISGLGVVDFTRVFMRAYANLPKAAPVDLHSNFKMFVLLISLPRKWQPLRFSVRACCEDVISNNFLANSCFSNGFRNLSEIAWIIVPICTSMSESVRNHHNSSEIVIIRPAQSVSVLIRPSLSEFLRFYPN